MKIALYIEDGLEQIVLTPESGTEAALLGKLHDGSRELSIKQGAFYGCQGGWTRWKRPTSSIYDFHPSDHLYNEDESTMIVLRPVKRAEKVDASGIEAGTAETEGLGSETESPSGG